MKRTLLAFLCALFALCLVLVSCSAPAGQEFSRTTFSVTTDEDTALLSEKDEQRLLEATSSPFPSDSFAGENWLCPDEIEGLYEALTARLEQMEPGTGFRLSNPDAESPDERYEHFFGGDGLFLFDWNLDGFPELVEYYWGKTPLFQVTDLRGGEVFSGNLCAFPVLLYDTTDGSFSPYSIGDAEFGWADRVFEVSELSLSADGLSRARLSYKEAALNLYEDESGMHSDFAADFYLEGEKVTPEEWLAAFETFRLSHLRVREADYEILLWRDICDENDTPQVYAQKAADALFASGVKFLQRD